MNTPFKYDVVISHIPEDVLTARHLVQRLGPRLQASILVPDVGEHADDARHAAALHSDARVVVVLHQRLWGETAATKRDELAIQQRIAQRGAEFLVFVSLDPAMKAPTWAKGAVTLTHLSADGDAEVDAIAAAVLRAGGTPNGPRQRSGVGAPDGAALTEVPRTAFKMANVAHKEVGALIDEIEERAEDLQVRFPDVKVAVRRTAERCVLQAGDLGLSVSWLPPSGGDSGSGGLLVMEWEGTITFPGESAQRGRRATSTREELLRLETDGSLAWNWSADGAPLRKYSSADLASLYVGCIAWQLEQRAGQSDPAVEASAR